MKIQLPTLTLILSLTSFCAYAMTPLSEKEASSISGLACGIQKLKEQGLFACMAQNILTVASLSKSLMALAGHTKHIVTRLRPKKWWKAHTATKIAFQIRPPKLAVKLCQLHHVRNTKPSNATRKMYFLQYRAL